MHLSFCTQNLFFLFFVFRQGLSYYLTVDAQHEECFFEKVSLGSVMTLTYEVSEGGFLDIDVTVVDPDGKMIHDQSGESSGKFSINTAKTGSYKYCFSNIFSTKTSKVLLFNMEVVEPENEDVDTEKKDKHPILTTIGEEEKKIASMLRMLRGGLTRAKYEQQYLNIRDKMHRSINESTNTRLVIWAFLQAFFLLSMTVGQIYYIKRFFEVSRVV
ncbi:transmembrane emp24 domain-containing protein 2-like [Daktulosphaira vitifoliae]|uniref:transmembrane emp24 domain-containing protein 2-like n=1 Tax=Daktulosphaira vitifoliae TaxID=58002 RepID=UPI0021AA431E|nr:transmembrane emp24 domain-containing protein 2-like [Daktulosphaira vitifoliae]